MTGVACIGDDGIAMHGQYYAVVSTDASQHTMIVASAGEFGFLVDDVLTFYGADTVCKGSSTIASLHSVMQPDATDGKSNPILSDLKPFSYDDCDYIQASSPVVNPVIMCRLPCLKPL